MKASYLLLALALLASCSTSREARLAEKRRAMWEYYNSHYGQQGTLGNLGTPHPDTTKPAPALVQKPYVVPVPPNSRPITHIGDLQAPPTIVVQPHRSLVDKVLGRKKASLSAPLSSKGGAGGGVPKKCKGCTFYVAGGDQTNSTAAKNATAGAGATGGGKADGPVAGTGATAFEKAKAPLTTGPGDATDQSGTGAASSIKGDGNAPVLTNTAPKPLGVGATIAKALSEPLGITLALFTAGGLVWLALWLRRSKKAADTIS